MIPSSPVTITLSPKQFMLLVAGVVVAIGACIALITGVITIEQFLKIVEYIFMMFTGLVSFVVVKSWLVC